MTQTEMLTNLLDEVEMDGHECDLIVLDLLDYFGILGYKLVKDSTGTASKEYGAHIQRAVQEMETQS
jgi:hypothetical protein